MLKKKNESIQYLEEALAYSRKFLPEQGPLEYFVHHNTLHSFEHLNFFQALESAKSLYGAKTHKSFRWFNKRYRENRISEKDIETVIDQNLPMFSDSSKKLVRNLLNWEESFHSEKTSIQKEKFLTDIHWSSVEVSCQFHILETYWENIKKTSNETYLKNTIKDIRIKFLAAFFDKGLAYWQMEDRHKGLFYCFSEYCHHLPGIGYSKVLKDELRDLKNQNFESASEMICYLLESLEVPRDLWSQFIFKSLYLIKGWTSLVISLDSNQLVNPTNIQIDFEEYVVANLLIELAAFRFLSKKSMLNEFEYQLNLKLIDYEKKSLPSYLYDLLAKDLKSATEFDLEFEKLRKEGFLEKINKNFLLRIWQEAYEWSIVQNTLSVLSENRSSSSNQEAESSIPIQVITCIDDREESTRRHLEEVDPSIQTFGYAGHFGLNILFKGIKDVFYRALCPVNAVPDKYIWEECVDSSESTKTLKGKINYFFYHRSKLPMEGFLFSIIFGPFSILRFMLDLFFPGSKIFPEATPQMELKTKLNYEENTERDKSGYSVGEMVEVVFGMLKTIGLTKNFSEIIYICGHGSSCLNNPHEAAYNCGACGGGRGAPNARLLATIANREDVRDLLRDRGINLDNRITFIGGYHNTCNNDFLIFDEELFPQEKIVKLKETLLKVAKLDAKERVRKFFDVKLNISPELSFKNVKSRALNISELRPEYGHSTNAICYVGDRDVTKNVFLDRRAFLVSYDGKNDSDNKVLSALMSSIVPVCAGINLEYFFSYVDREVFGSGAKQPHNVTSLMGVMNGYKGDLRLGLPWQMVEIHEPVRIFIVLESSIEGFEKALAVSGAAGNLIHNEWVRIGLLTPEGKTYYYHGNKMIEVISSEISLSSDKSSSLEYASDRRDILPFKVLRT